MRMYDMMLHVQPLAHAQSTHFSTAEYRIVSESTDYARNISVVSSTSTLKEKGCCKRRHGEHGKERIGKQLQSKVST